jgi:transcriptional regulator NrdR family protein
MAISDARGLSETVVAHICIQTTTRQQASEQRSQVAVSTIYTVVLRTLQRFDRAAATHYAAFHPQRSTKAY